MSLLLLTIGSAMLLAAQNNTRSLGPVWVDVPTQLDCPDQDALLTALRVRLGPERVRVGQGSAQGLGLRLVARRSRGVTMVLREGGSSIVERNIEVEGQCTALAHTVALIAESWLETTPPRSRAKSRVGSTEAPNPMPPAPEKAIAAESKAGGVREVGVGPESSELATASAPLPAAPAERASNPPPPPAVETASSPPPLRAIEKPSSATPNRAPHAEAPAQAAIPARVEERTWLTIAASAGAVVAIQESARWTAAGLLDVQLGYRRWFLGVRGAWESNADLSASPNNVVTGVSESASSSSSGRVAVRYVPLAAYLGRVLVDGHGLTFAALGGGGVDVLSARASGYSSGRSLTAVDPMVLAGLRGEWRFTERFGVVATSDLALALRRDQFSVANLGPVARTTRARAGCALGVAWHLR